MTPRSAGSVLADMLAVRAPGWAVPHEPGSNLGRLLSAPAAEVAAAEGAAADLLRESDPRQAGFLLAEWESAAGLPDACVGEPASEAQRRALVVQRLTGARGQTKAFFESVAAALGFVARAEDYRVLSAGFRAGAPAADAQWIHAWTMHVSGATAEQALPLMCIGGRLKPAQTRVVFAFGG